MCGIWGQFWFCPHLSSPVRRGLRTRKPNARAVVAVSAVVAVIFTRCQENRPAPGADLLPEKVHWPFQRPTPLEVLPAHFVRGVIRPPRVRQSPKTVEVRKPFRLVVGSPVFCSFPAFAQGAPRMCPQLPPLFRHVPPLFENEPLNVPPHTPGFRHTSAHVCALVKATSHREKEKGRTFWELCGLVCGARGRNRTGTPCGGGF